MYPTQPYHARYVFTCVQYVNIHVKYWHGLRAQTLKAYHSMCKIIRVNWNSSSR